MKAASINADTVLVSWLPPAWPNGEILTYTLYKQSDRVSKGDGSLERMGGGGRLLRTG